MPRALAWVLLAALLARLIGFLLMFVLPGVSDPLALGGGDQAGYAFLARYVHQTGRLDDALFLPRPPGYPLLIAALYAVFGVNPWLMVFANAALGVLTAGLTWALARDMSGDERLALLAGLWAALDPAGVIHTLNPLSEALANATLALALWLVWRLSRGNRAARPHYGTAALAGVALAASTLTRPTTLFFWAVLGLWLLVVNWRASGIHAAWRHALVLVMACLLPLGGWIVHNGQTFGVAEFSTAGTWSMLFVRGTSVLHQATGADVADVQRDLVIELARRRGQPLDPATVRPESIWDSYIRANPQEQALMRAMALEIFARYPLHTLYTLGIGLGRMFALTEELYPVWPLEALYHLVFYGLAAWGTWALWRENRRAALLLILTGLYLVGVTLLNVTINDTRMRSPLIPVLCLLAAYGVRAVRERRQGRGDGQVAQLSTRK